jgi:hypothetical protein
VQSKPSHDGVSAEVPVQGGYTSEVKREVDGLTQDQSLQNPQTYERPHEETRLREHSPQSSSTGDYYSQFNKQGLKTVIIEKGDEENKPKPSNGDASSADVPPIKEAGKNKNTPT